MEAVERVREPDEFAIDGKVMLIVSSLAVFFNLTWVKLESLFCYTFDIGLAWHFTITATHMGRMVTRMASTVTHMAPMMVGIHLNPVILVFH